MQFVGIVWEKCRLMGCVDIYPITCLKAKLNERLLLIQDANDELKGYAEYSGKDLSVLVKCVQFSILLMKKCNRVLNMKDVHLYDQLWKSISSLQDSIDDVVCDVTCEENEPQIHTLKNSILLVCECLMEMSLEQTDMDWVIKLEVLTREFTE